MSLSQDFTEVPWAPDTQADGLIQSLFSNNTESVSKPKKKKKHKSPEASSSPKNPKTLSPEITTKDDFIEKPRKQKRKGNKNLHAEEKSLRDNNIPNQKEHTMSVKKKLKQKQKYSAQDVTDQKSVKKQTKTAKIKEKRISNLKSTNLQHNTVPYDVTNTQNTENKHSNSNIKSKIHNVARDLDASQDNHQSQDSPGQKTVAFNKKYRKNKFKNPEYKQKSKPFVSIAENEEMKDSTQKETGEMSTKQVKDKLPTKQHGLNKPIDISGKEKLKTVKKIEDKNSVVSVNKKKTQPDKKNKKIKLRNLPGTEISVIAAEQNISPVRKSSVPDAVPKKNKDKNLKRKKEDNLDVPVKKRKPSHAKSKKGISPSLSEQMPDHQLYKGRSKSGKINKPSATTSVVPGAMMTKVRPKPTPFNLQRLKNILQSKSTLMPKTSEHHTDDDLPTDVSQQKKRATSAGKETMSTEKSNITSSNLVDRMQEQLKQARFRYLNQQLYTQTGDEAYQMFQGDTGAFEVYHEGFQSQVNKWPENPLNRMIDYIRARPKTNIVGDFGCGDAQLALNVPNEVYSFDLVAANARVTACDMKHVPLQSTSLDIAVFCLSLMGTNLVDYILEAHRVLKKGGTLLVAEVISRFEDLSSFARKMQKLGFLKVEQDDSNKMFVWFMFKKAGQIHKELIPSIELQPCVYKKR